MHFPRQGRGEGNTLGAGCQNRCCGFYNLNCLQRVESSMSQATVARVVASLRTEHG